MIVVGIDLFIVFLLFVLIWYYKVNQEMVAEDIDQSEITASDFTVEIRSLPALHFSYEEQKANLWEWIEKIASSKLCEQGLEAPDGKVDENQNNLASLTFGLSDVGRMEILLELAELLKREKGI